MQFEWTVFFGDAADAEARVYVLATPLGDSLDAASLEGLKITGRVEGPKCRYSHTLPARIPVRFRGVRTSDGRAELVGEAIVPDPNFWTSELPFLYRATVEVRCGEEIVVSYEQDFGIRPLGVRGKRLVFGGKTWVPRAVRREVVVGEAPLELWRETATVMVVDDPADELCREASEIGVILFARISKAGPNLPDTVRKLGRYPAVAAIFVSSDVFVPELDPTLARNALLVQELVAERGVIGYSEWARAFSWSVGRLDCVIWDLGPGLVHRNTGKRTLIEARAACDSLQADLAGKCDPAGYVV